jgi:hypothetical protein
MPLKEDQCSYEKELKIIFRAICDGFIQEVQLRKSMIRKYPGEGEKNFPLIFEKERGISSILAFYLRKAGFFVRVENWFNDRDEELKNRTPDLVIWLPKKETDFFLEIKPIQLKDSRKVVLQKINYDLKKLSKAENKHGYNYYSGFLAFGFAEIDEQQKELQRNYEGWSRYIEGYKEKGHKENIFRKLGKIETVSLEDLKLKSVIVGFWYRENGLMN